MPRRRSMRYNQELIKANNSDGLIEVLDTFGKTNYFPDIYFINPLIKKLGEPNKRRGRNPLISSLSNKERLDTCKYLFDYASYCKIADVFTYGSLIDAAGKNKNLALAIYLN